MGVAGPGETLAYLAAVVQLAQDGTTATSAPPPVGAGAPWREARGLAQAVSRLGPARMHRRGGRRALLSLLACGAFFLLVLTLRVETEGPLPWFAAVVTEQVFQITERPQQVSGLEVRALDLGHLPPLLLPLY